MTGAFGAEACKQALLTEIRDEGEVYKRWLTPEAIEGDLAPIARDFNLHPAFVRIMPVLGGYGQGRAKSFYTAAIDALPVGADVLPSISRWFLFAWEEPTWGISNAVKDTALWGPGLEIIDLVRQSQNGQIDKATWRAARARLTAAQTAAGLGNDLIEPLLAMAWNLDQTPGAAGDVANSWSLPAIFAPLSDTVDQLTPAEQQTLTQHMTKAHEHAVAELGEIKKDAEGYAAYQRLTEAYWSSVPETAPLRERSAAQRARIQARVEDWRSTAQRGFVEALGGAPLSSAAIDKL